MQRKWTFPDSLLLVAVGGTTILEGVLEDCGTDERIFVKIILQGTHLLSLSAIGALITLNTNGTLGGTKVINTDDLVIHTTISRNNETSKQSNRLMIKYTIH